MREVRALNRAGRVNQIVIAFQQEFWAGRATELTAYAIAKKIGMRAQSPSFRDVLKYMLDIGLLSCREVQTKSTGINGGVRFYWKLIGDAAPKKREIAIRANGRQIGQLELF